MNDLQKIMLQYETTAALLRQERDMWRQVMIQLGELHEKVDRLENKFHTNEKWPEG